MNDKCKDCKYENKCACYECFRLDRKDMFEPKTVDIIPQKAGELWEYEEERFFTYTLGGNEELHLQAPYGSSCRVSMAKDIHGAEMIHGNGWTRLDPKVEDENIERREFDNVNALSFYEGNMLKANELPNGKTAKMILEIPKEDK